MIWTETAQAQNSTLDVAWEMLDYDATGKTYPTEFRPVGQELALCQQMMLGAGNAAELQLLVSKLVTEQGLPADAAAVAMTLLTPGVDVTSKVMQIESLIKSGG